MAMEVRTQSYDYIPAEPFEDVLADADAYLEAVARHPSVSP